MLKTFIGVALLILGLWVNDEANLYERRGMVIKAKKLKIIAAIVLILAILLWIIVPA